jgi:serine phosphatase RsbU (regulator of sigma subunit)
MNVHATTVVVSVVGVVLTALLTVAAWSSHERNEDRLLRERVQGAGAVIAASLPSVQTPLAVAAELAEETDGTNEPAFERAIAPLVGDDRQFISASIWAVGGTTPLMVIGEAPALATEPVDRIRSFMTESARSDRLSITDLVEDDRLGYSYSSRRPQAAFVAYAEAALPADRMSIELEDTAFGGLDFAIYFGAREVRSRLMLSSTPDLPISGRRASELVDFGAEQFLLVMKPRGQLGGSLLAWLPLLVLVIGLGTTASSALLTERLLRRRREAEVLADENARLYDEQRAVAHTLQRSLLPQQLPNVRGAELAVRYTPGVADMEIGGDWYDIVPVSADRFVVAVGDVSGRGLRAASVMASVRFATRAYAADGDPPGDILSKLNAVDDPDRHGQFITVVCVLVDLAAGTATIANAGHPLPLVLDPAGARFVQTHVGPPIGVVRGAVYESATVALAPAATLLLFTDGLFERRGETIDDGMDRLRRSAAVHTGTLDELLDGVVTDLLSPGTDDDAAILGVRWRA